jgi:hypothetical protein
MAEHNYAAGVQMTMGTVVRNYLRWFELNQCKREIASSFAPRRLPFFTARETHEWDLQADSPGRNGNATIRPIAQVTRPVDFTDPGTWNSRTVALEHVDGD